MACAGSSGCCCGTRSSLLRAWEWSSDRAGNLSWAGCLIATWCVPPRAPTLSKLTAPSTTAARLRPPPRRPRPLLARHRLQRLQPFSPSRILPNRLRPPVRQAETLLLPRLLPPPLLRHLPHQRALPHLHPPSFPPLDSSDFSHSRIGTRTDGMDCGGRGGVSRTLVQVPPGGSFDAWRAMDGTVEGCGYQRNDGEGCGPVYAY